MIANEHGSTSSGSATPSRTTTRVPPTCPAPGFAAGPCLFKDTMQLAAFNNNNFTLGHASMMVNEGLPLYLVDRIEQRFDLAELDRRHPRHGVQGRERRHPVEPRPTSSSASCGSRPREVLCTDPYVTVDPDLRPARRGARRGRHPRHRRTARARTRRCSRRSRSSTSGTCSAEGSACDAARLGRHPGLQRGRAHQAGASTASSRRSRCRARSWSSSTTPRRHDRARTSRTSPRTRRTSGAVVNTYGRGPANAIRYGIDHAAAPVVVVTMADGCDDPFQIDDLDPAGRAGRRGRGREPLRPHAVSRSAGRG